MSNLTSIEIPTSVTAHCPIKNFRPRYLHMGCVKCEYFKGIQALTDAIDMEVKDPVTGIVTGMRPIEWHEKFMIRCAFPITRRCSNMAIAED